MNYWVVPITIGKSERFRETAGALFPYQLSQYDSWIGDWGTAGDVLTSTVFNLGAAIFFNWGLCVIMIVLYVSSSLSIQCTTYICG